MKKIIIISAVILFTAIAFASTITERRISLQKRMITIESRLEIISIRLDNLEKKIYPKRDNVNFQNSFNLGDIGYLNHVKIIQIIDSNNILAEFQQYSYSTASISFNGESRFLTNVPNNIVYKEHLVYIAGIDTSGMRDGQFIYLDNNFKIIGNKSIFDRYQGKQTVFLLESVKIDD